MLGFLILVLTLLAAGGATFLALQLPPAYIQQWKLISGGILVGLLFGTIFYWQQMRAVNRAAQEREAAIEEASNRAVYETTQRVTEEMSKRYEPKIQSLTKQVANLESQLPNQGMNLNVVGDSTAAANKTGPAGAPNSNAAKQAGSTPNIFWIQSDDNVGKGAAVVQFRIYGPLNVPAFVAICDHPCRAVSGQAGPGSEGFPVIGSTNRDVAGFIFKKPKPMPAGTEGTVRIESSDRESVQVTTFRILRESEVPADLR